jgi:hypothetical protein
MYEITYPGQEILEKYLVPIHQMIGTQDFQILFILNFLPNFNTSTINHISVVKLRGDRETQRCLVRGCTYWHCQMLPMWAHDGNYVVEMIPI